MTMTVLATIVSFLFRFYSLLILIRVLISWLSLTGPQPWLDHPAVRLLAQVTDPVLRPFQRLIPPIGGLDISPIIVLFALEIGRRLVIGLLLGL